MEAMEARKSFPVVFSVLKLDAILVTDADSCIPAQIQMKTRDPLLQRERAAKLKAPIPIIIWMLATTRNQAVQ
jgi:hypothetical protein